MCYASQTKGRYAIFIESLVAATLGLYDLLVEELKSSQAATYADIEKMVPGIPLKAGRWIAEMEEIAATFGEVGMTQRIFAESPTCIEPLTEPIPRPWMEPHSSS